MYVCMYVCVCVCVYIYIYIYIYMYMYTQDVPRVTVTIRDLIPELILSQNPTYVYEWGRCNIFLGLVKSDPGDLSALNL